MDCDLATAPTGCAASLIDGETNCRAFKIPTRKDVLKQPPSDMNITDVREQVTFYSKYKKLFQCVMDEDSMTGCSAFAWIAHRIEEGRKGAHDFARQKGETPPFSHAIS